MAGTIQIDLFLLALKSDRSSKSEVILDFFAGSGSSGHAVHQFNYFKDTAHKYLLVQLPELIEANEEAYKIGYKKISDISKERIRRAIKQIDKNQGFKVYKQDTSTIYKWQEFVPDQDGVLPDLFNSLELAYKNPLQDGVTTQDFITEVILQEGFPLSAKKEEVVSGVFKISHEWVPYTLYTTMLYSFKDTNFNKLQLQDSDHFVCLDKAFEGNDALKQELDNQCKIFTI